MFIHTYTGKNSQEVRLTIKPIEQNIPNISESLAFVGFYMVQHLLFGLQQEVPNPKSIMFSGH
jgi:hypothetical protein